MRTIKHIFTLMLIICITAGYIPALAMSGGISEYEDDSSPPAASEETQTEAENGTSAAEEDGEAHEEAKDSVTPAEEAVAGTDTGEEKAGEAGSEEGGSEKNDGETEKTNIEGSQGTEEENSRKEISFTADQADFLSYDPLYIARYANRSYISTDKIEMDHYVNVVTAAKGVATYNLAKQSDFEVTEGNYLAGMNYEMPVYNIDDNSRYYIVIPNVNKFNANFKAYDLMVAYNNDYGETINGWKYEKGILYIPKTAVDNPKCSEKVPDGALIAVQLNYAAGRDMDFSKIIPVQILSGKKPKNKTIRTENIFDVDSISFSTGVRHRKAEDISVFLNGQLLPVNSDAWDYSASDGKLSIKAMPGVVSNINVVFEKQTKKEKIRNFAISAVSMLAGEAYAAGTSSMTVLKTADGKEVTLKFDESRMFEGWRGHYKSKVIHKVASSNFTGLSGWKNSVKYLYGGYTSMTGSDMKTSSKKEIDAGLTPLWTIQSFAVGADVGLATNTDDIQCGTAVKHYVTASDTETHTMYEWLLLYRNKLEKSKEVYADSQGNGIGGANNFAMHWPITTVTGAAKGLVPAEDGVTGKPNPDICFESDEISSSEWFAASCSELDDAASGESEGDVFVTCLALTDEYIVLAFAQARSGQNACAIYKFRVQPKGYVCLIKKNGSGAIDYVKEAPNNYSLKDAVYHLYTDPGCTVRASDASGNEIELRTDDSGSTAAVKVLPGMYYAKEVSASSGYEYEKPEGGSYPGVYVTSANTSDDPAVITSYEPPSAAAPALKIYKTDPTGRYGWNKLRGAKYKISYYDVTSGSEIEGAEPKRSWIFSTVKMEDADTGAVCAGFDWQNDEPEKGSDDFYIENGKRIIPCGWFTVREISAPSGLSVDDTVRFGRVYQPENGASAVIGAEGADSSGLEIKLNVTDTPQSVKIVIDKRNGSTGENRARETEDDHSEGRLAGYTSLEGAEYEVYYDDNDLPEPELIGIIVTDSEGHGELSERTLGDSRFIGEKLPAGEYIIIETKSPPGFVTDEYEYLDGKEMTAADRSEDVICDYESDDISVTKIISGRYRDGMHIFRTRAEDKDIKQFTYTVISKDEPTRTYVKKTDSVTGEHVKGAKLQIIADDGEDAGKVIEEWVSDGTEHIVWELKAGKYRLRETEAPEGYQLAEDQEFEIEENKIISRLEMKNIHVPEPGIVRTLALDKASGTHNIFAGDNAVIVDTVEYRDLTPGGSYVIEGEIFDKTSGQPAGVTGRADLIPESADGTIQIEFTLDATGMEGHTLVVFETLKLNGVTISEHRDPDDADQMIFVTDPPESGETPKTGDSALVFVYAAAAVLSSVLLALMIAILRRKMYN